MPKPSLVTAETGVVLAVVVLSICAGVPWLLERRTAAGLARGHEACARILDAILSYRADQGFIPTSVNSNARGPIGRDERQEPLASPLSFLTAPLPYLSNLPRAPFGSRSRGLNGFVVVAVDPDMATGTVAVLCEGPGRSPELPSPDVDQVTDILWEFREGVAEPRREVWYSPSNGMFSAGWIYRDSEGNVSPGG